MAKRQLPSYVTDYKAPDKLWEHPESFVWSPYSRVGYNIFFPPIISDAKFIYINVPGYDELHQDRDAWHLVARVQEVTQPDIRLTVDTYPLTFGTTYYTVKEVSTGDTFTVQYGDSWDTKVTQFHLLWIGKIWHNMRFGDWKADPRALARITIWKTTPDLMGIIARVDYYGCTPATHDISRLLNAALGDTNPVNIPITYAFVFRVMHFGLTLKNDVVEPVDYLLGDLNSIRTFCGLRPLSVSEYRDYWTSYSTQTIEKEAEKVLTSSTPNAPTPFPPSEEPGAAI